MSARGEGAEREAGREEGSPAGVRSWGPGRWMQAAVRILAGVVGAALILASAATVFLIQTRAGRDLAARYAEDVLGGMVEGRVEVGRVTGGNLISRVGVSRFAMYGPDGAPFLLLRDVRAEYNPVTLLRGRYVLRRVRVGRGRLHLLREPGERWNYERLFPPGEDIHLSLHDVRLREGRVVVRHPHRPAAEGEEPWWVERGEDGGWRREFVLDSLRGTLPRIRASDPAGPTEVEVGDLAGTARVVREPLPFRLSDASLTLDETVRVTFGGAAVGRSRLQGSGWVETAGGGGYRFDLRADPLSFRDLGWLPFPLPREGGGPVDLTVASAEGGTRVDARDARIRVGDSRVRGRLDLLAAERPRIDTLDVRLEPLRLRRASRLAGEAIGIDGLAVGRIRGKGTPGAFHVDGRVELTGADGGAASVVEARGLVGLAGPARAEDLEVRLRNFDPRWAGPLGLPSGVAGRLSGEGILSVVPDSLFSFRGRLTQLIRGEAASQVRGRARVSGREERRVEVDVALDPLAFASLEPLLPRLESAGRVRGSVQAEGPLSGLQVDGELTGPRGEIDLAGRFDLASDPPAYDGRVTVRALRLQEWVEGAPETRLAFRGSVEGKGTDPATLRARFDLEILPSVVAEAAVDTSLLRLTVEEGLARLDTLSVRADVGRARGRGTLGLARDRSGTLEVSAEAPDLSRWNRWILPGRNPVRADTSVADLFRTFPEVGREPGPEPVEAAAAEPPARDTLSGAARLQGLLEGSVHAFSLRGTLASRGAGYGSAGADSLRATVDLRFPLHPDSLTVQGTAWRARWRGVRADSVRLRWARRGEGTHEFRLQAARDTALSAEAAGEVSLAGDGRRVRLRRLGLGFGDQRLELVEPAVVGLGEDGLTVDSLRLAGEGGAVLFAWARIPRRGEARADLRLRGLRLAGLARAAPGSDSVGGTLAADLRIRGTVTRPSMEGRAAVERPRFAGAAYDSLELSFAYGERVARPALTLWTGGRPVLEAGGRVRANLALREVDDRTPEDPVDLTFRARELPLGWVGLAAENVRAVEGTAGGELRLRGEPGEFRYDGAVELSGASARVPPLGVRYTVEEGRLAFEGSAARVDSLLVASAAGGTLLADGRVGLSEFTNPGLDLDLRARRFRAVDLRTLSAALDGEMRMSGSYEEPRVSGSVRASNGEVRVARFIRQRRVVDVTDVEAYPLVDTTLAADRKLVEELRNPFLQNLAVEMDVAVGPDLWLRSPDLDVEVSGNLRVLMDPTEEVLSVFGPVRLQRGRYRYSLCPGDRSSRVCPYSRQLRITGGTIEFVGTPGVNPSLDVTAVYRTGGPTGQPVTVRANLRGTLLNKTLALSSEPPMSESDQICYLLFSTECLALTGPGGGGGPALGRTVQEQLVGTVGSGLASLLVQDTWLDYATLSQAPGTGTRERGTGLFSSSLFARTEVEAGKYLGSDLFVTVSQPLGRSRGPGATLNWQFQRHWTLEARTQNQYLPTGGLALTSGLDTRRMWGLFLFRDWGF